MPTKETTTKKAKKTVAKKKPAVAKKIAKKEVAPKKKAEKNVFDGKYFYAVGRRKTAVAKVKLFDSFGKEEIIVNGKKFDEYFSTPAQMNSVREPFVSLGKENGYCVEAKIIGGGISAQSEALRLGISRAMVISDEEFRKPLKDLGFLTRDSRKVERKKPGLKKARRAPQWSKR